METRRYVLECVGDYGFGGFLGFTIGDVVGEMLGCLYGSLTDTTTNRHKTVGSEK